MKKLVLILLAVSISTGAFSQFGWGIKGGASSNSFKMDQIDITSTQNTLAAAEEASWGFHGGAFVRVSLFGLIVQPEVLFSTAENNIMVSSSTVDEIKTQSFSKLDVPVMLGVKLGPVRVMAGPAASVMLSSDSNILADAEDLYKAATFGYQAGLGVDLFKMLTLDVRYEGGLSNFGDEIVVAGETVELDGRSNAIVLSAGIMF